MDEDEPILTEREHRRHLVAIVVICALIALVSWLPRCSTEPALKPPPQNATGPWRVPVPGE